MFSGRPTRRTVTSTHNVGPEAEALPLTITDRDIELESDLPKYRLYAHMFNAGRSSEVNIIPLQSGETEGFVE